MEIDFAFCFCVLHTKSLLISFFQKSFFTSNHDFVALMIAPRCITLVTPIHACTQKQSIGGLAPLTASAGFEPSRAFLADLKENGFLRGHTLVHKNVSGEDAVSFENGRGDSHQMSSSK